MAKEKIDNSSIHFVRITSNNVIEICKMSQTLSEEQRMAVNDNSVSIAQGHYSENAWMRAIYEGQTPISLSCFTLDQIGKMELTATEFFSGG